MEGDRSFVSSMVASDKRPNSFVSNSYDLLDDLTLRPKSNEDGTRQHTDIALERHLLCKMCQHIVEEAQTSAPKICLMPIHETIDELKDSILRGCHLCSFFWTLRCAEDLPYEPQITVENYARLMTLKYSKSLQHIQIAKLYTNPDLIAPQYVKAIMSVTNASNACFEIAASWISECMAEHQWCRKVQSAALRMPTRLIELSASPSSALRIVYPTDHVAYLTVSHCWGASDVLKLTKENYERLLDGFKETELPQLYRDCVQVARRLGFQYLWLDSLCIIQDSEEDWLEEGWRMGDVYRGSSCTIAAVSCSDSASSLFTRYHPLTNSDIYYPTLDGKGTLRIPYPFHEFAEPLHDRAWVLQERLLSPRTLEYTLAGMRWHCEEMVFHRPDPDSRPKDEEVINSVPRLNHQWRELVNMQSSRLTNADRLRGQQAWMEVLKTYAETKLTFENDRPHAIKGVISVLQRQTGLKLHAGVCADFAPYSLLWRVVFPNAQWKYGKYKCPSWSSSFIPIECETLPGIQAGTRCYQADFKFTDQTLEVSGRSSTSATIELDQQVGSDLGGWPAIHGAVMRLETDGEQPWYSDVFLTEDQLDVSLDFTPNGPIEVDLVLLLVEEYDASTGARDSNEVHADNGFNLLSNTMGSERLLPSKEIQPLDDRERRKDSREFACRGIILIKSPVDTMGEVWVRIGIFSLFVAADGEDEISKYFPGEKSYLVI